MELLHHSVRCVGDVVHHHIQIHLIWLVSVSVEGLSHFHAIGVMEHFQNGQLSVFVPLVLENLLDSHGFPSFCDRCFENHTEGSVSDDLLSVVGHTLLFLAASSLLIVVFLKFKNS